MKVKKIVGLLLSAVIGITSSMPVSAATDKKQDNKAGATLAINSKSCILIEPTTGKILLEQNKDEKLPLASVTKVMTMLLIYDAIDSGKIHWEDMVTVSTHAAGMGGSQIFLEPNEKMSVKDLVKCIVVASANDASVAMAEYIAGSEDAFVALMNQKAKDLGMNNTHFVNACGLDAPNHYSSAYDVALMSQELINKHPQIFEFTKIWQDSIIHKTSKGEQSFGLANTNKLIKTYTGATGLKTGSTSDALYCLSGTAQRDGMSLIAVVLGAPTPTDRFQETTKMLDYGFSNFAIATGKKAGEVVGTINIYKGDKEKINVVVKNQIDIVVGKGKDRNLESKVEISDYLNAPVKKGVKAGEIIYSFEGKEVGRCDLITSEDTGKISLPVMMGRLLSKWF